MILNILYHGLSCFTIEAKSTSKSATVVIDPFSTKGTGLRLPRTISADILTVSSDKELHNNVSAVEKPELLITEPGEYEKGGIFVYGIFSPVLEGEKGEDTIIFRYEFEDLVVAHLGDLTHKLTDDEFSRLEKVDILMLPVGDAERTIGYKAAVDIANQIEPRIIIPMHYKMPGLNVKLDSVEKFLKEYGAKEERMNKLKVAKKDLPQEETRVVVLDKS
ncbi:MBL fold metallo-hydrolase [Patescibacteria group bacterium]|nr:MBL fold metallo-hydrolase [Patescibacteria group bacterium]